VTTLCVLQVRQIDLVCTERVGMRPKGWRATVYADGRYERSWGSCSVDEGRWRFMLSSYSGAGGGGVAVATSRFEQDVRSRIKGGRKRGCYRELECAVESYSSLGGGGSSTSAAVEDVEREEDEEEVVVVDEEELEEEDPGGDELPAPPPPPAAAATAAATAAAV
jgi:hypothetical protein